MDQKSLLKEVTFDLILYKKNLILLMLKIELKTSYKVCLRWSQSYSFFLRYVSYFR